ncbi:hypothetical protein BD413DRAFT_629529 [Trametes elegans]|nr:hypothetical protein BD413DRAFT_629529 [Trametes elegans]
MADQTSAIQTTLAEVITGVRDIRNTQFISFVCIEREVELIWKKRWSVVKFAFLWHRYFGLVCVILQLYGQHPVDPTCDSCSFWFYWETWGYCAVLFTSEAVLLLWIYVVYNKNRYILAVMGVFYLAEVASVLTILAISFKNFEARAFFLVGVHYCIMDELPKTFQLLWVPILAYDTLLLLLFLYRGCGSTLGCNRALSYSYDGLLDMVYRHSLLNFLAIFGTYMACATIWLTSRISLYQIPVGFALALSITNCTRLLLNIRRAYYSGVSDPLLFNIRDIPATGANTPNMLDVPIPLSPLSATSGASTISAGSTARDPSKSTTPVPTFRAHAYAHARRLSIATTSSELLRQVSVSAREAGGAGPRPRARAEQGAVYVTTDVDPAWWHHELREMRADPAVAIGEAL